VQQLINEGVRKWTKKEHTLKTGKSSARKPGKSKKGRKMWINEENNWILDQPHQGVRKWTNLIHLGLVG
jgi:hypothetical protein